MFIRSFSGRFGRTDSSGQVQFLLPANSYKFRVDYEGTQYWSDVISIIPHEENNIDLQLDLLADLTNAPNPVRFDGVPPVYEPEKVMVASLGSIRGLLLHSVVGQTTGSEEIYYFINDHLGTPQKLLNENANVVWSADYKPFGEADVYVNTFANNFRFPGQYYDQETGLHYNYHRYYEPTTGRYLSADPLGTDGGINLYSYASANPLIRIDPFGLAWGSYEAFAHYFSGGGNVSLQAIGHYSTVTQDVQPKMNDWKTRAKRDAEGAAKSTLSCPNLTTTSISKSDSVGIQTSVYWIGGISFFRNYWCTITADCCKKTFSYTCMLTYSMSDPFSDIWDVFNLVPGNWDPVGTPYNVTGSWNDTVSGSGNL